MHKYVISQAARLECVLARLAIAPVRAARLDAGEALLFAHKVCLGCPRTAACDRWLRQSADCAIESAPLASFCPNAAFFQRCAAVAEAYQTV